MYVLEFQKSTKTKTKTLAAAIDSHDQALSVVDMESPRLD
jgi:hypothetical protein